MCFRSRGRLNAVPRDTHPERQEELVIKPCLICGDRGEHAVFVVREMYFGTREEFSYVECRSCGTLQIIDIPADLGRYYPSNYYSFVIREKPASSTEVSLRRLRTNAWLGSTTTVWGRMLARFSSRRPEYLDWFSGMNLSTDSRILDVGCGGGQLLLKLRRDGFTNLKGVDPFLDKSTKLGSGLELANHAFDDERGIYDLVMFHHSLEHMDDPVGMLAHARTLLSAGGHVLIRLPLAGCFAWRKYRQHWYAIDAPRHLFVPSPRAMFLMAKRAGLGVRRRFFDSGPGELLASENYLYDIPLVSQAEVPEPDPERKAALAAFMKILNHVGDSDCGGFVLAST